MATAETKAMLERFGDVRVLVQVGLAPAALTLDRLANLEPGEIVRLGLPVSARAELQVNGRALAVGEVVISGSKRALALQELA